ncbi:MAG: metallophosphoesterase [Dermabacter sp.]|nr:metallophosphoesterase [Dermabacter sp.]
MRILHLSDTHVIDPQAPLTERLHYGRIDAAAALAGVLERLGAVGPLDAIVHTGDVSNDGSATSYRLVHDALAAFAREHGDPPLAVAMGNHDQAAPFAEVFGPGEIREFGSRGQRFLDRVVPLAGGGRIVVLDTSVPRAGWGTLEEPQLAWLDAALAERAEGPTLIALHHPPVRVPSRLFQGLSLGSETEDLGGAYAADLARLVEGRADAILAGHLHYALASQFAGIPVHVAPGVTNVVDPAAPLGTPEVERALALSGASILEIDTSHAVVSAASHWPSAGDTWAASEPDLGAQASAFSHVPVYSFDAATITAILAEAGRKNSAARNIRTAE